MKIILENWRKFLKESDEFKVHMMYDPASSDKKEAKVREDHNELAAKGYVHVDPEAIRKALRDEGGAAGFKAIVDLVKAEEKEVKKALDGMKDVAEHEDGDYILDDGDEVDVKKDIQEEKKKKDDRCTRIAKRKYDTWPSAYASGAVVQCRKGKIWKDLKEEDEELLEWEPLEEDEDLYEKKKKAKTDYSKEKKSGLHGWFSRQGAKGKTSGWVDCNTCRKDPKTGRKKCKACGREKGEKRAKYPSCRPTPAACGTAGKGKKWGKKK